ncbi:MAG: hypothetical protein ACI4E1_01085 [Lachnospira sp.]
MELIKSNEFCEMEEQELVTTDGGFWGALIAGFLVDGVVVAVTGKSSAEWAAKGITYVWDRYFTVTCY